MMSAWGQAPMKLVSPLALRPLPSAMPATKVPWLFFLPLRFGTNLIASFAIRIRAGGLKIANSRIDVIPRMDAPIVWQVHVGKVPRKAHREVSESRNLRLVPSNKSTRVSPLLGSLNP